MDNNILNNLVLYKGKRFSDLVDTNKISYLAARQPYQVSTILSLVFATKDNGYSTSLDMLTGGLGNVMVIDRPSFEWEVVMDTEHPVTIRKAEWQGAAVTAGTMAGFGNTPILIWAEEPHFGPTALLELDDKEFQLRVHGAPYKDGDYWVYTTYIANGNPSAYVPADLLQNGNMLSRLGSAVEEYSEEGDILNYSSNFKMRNYLTTLRLNYDITGSAYSEVMTVGMRDPKTGRVDYMWAPYQEWLALREWKRREERELVYMKTNVNRDGTCNLKGSNGRPVYIGAGLLEQIAPSNRRYYTRLTADLLEDFLFDLSYNVLGTTERKFLLLTGEMGMREFDRAIKEKLAFLTLVDTVFVTGTGDNLKFGGQFKTYSMNNGLEVTVKLFPLYDDTYHNRQLHPITLKPLESYRMTFVDFGRRDGQANIVKVVRKDREFVQWYAGGSVGPDGYGRSVNTIRSNGKDGYTVFFLGEVGIMVRDPRACGELIMIRE